MFVLCKISTFMMPKMPTSPNVTYFKVLEPKSGYFALLVFFLHSSEHSLVQRPCNSLAVRINNS